MKFNKNNLIEPKFLDSDGCINEDVLNTSTGLFNMIKGTNRRVSRFFGYGRKTAESDESSFGLRIRSIAKERDETEKENISHVEIAETQESPIRIQKPVSPSPRRALRPDKSLELQIRDRTMKSLGVKQLSPIDIGNSPAQQPVQLDTNKSSVKEPSTNLSSVQQPQPGTSRQADPDNAKNDPPRPSKPPIRARKVAEDSSDESDEDANAIKNFKKPLPIPAPRTSAQKIKQNISLRRSLFQIKENEEMGIVCSTPRTTNSNNEPPRFGQSMMFSPIKANSSTESANNLKRSGPRTSNESGIKPLKSPVEENSPPKRSDHQSAPMSIEKPMKAGVRIRSIAEIEKELEQDYANLRVGEKTPEKAKSKSKRLIESPIVDFEPKILIKKSNTIAVNKSKGRTDMEIEEIAVPISKTPNKFKQNETKNKTIRKSVCVQETPIHRNRELSLDRTISEEVEEVQKKLANISDSDENLTSDKSEEKQTSESVNLRRENGIEELQNDSDSPQLPIELIQSMKLAARVSRISPSPKSYALCKKSLRSRKQSDPAVSKYLDMSEKARKVFKKPKNRKRKNSEAVDNQTLKRRLYNRQEEEEEEEEEVIQEDNYNLRQTRARAQSVQIKPFKYPLPLNRRQSSPTIVKSRQTQNYTTETRTSNFRKSQDSEELDGIQENTVTSSRRSQKSSRELSSAEGTSTEEQNHVEENQEISEDRDDSEEREHADIAVESEEKSKEDREESEEELENDRRRSRRATEKDRKSKIAESNGNRMSRRSRKETDTSEESETESREHSEEEQEDLEEEQSDRRSRQTRASSPQNSEKDSQEYQENSEESEEEQSSNRRSRRVSSQQNSKKYSQEYQENSEESEEEQPSSRRSRQTRASSPQNFEKDSEEYQENSEESEEEQQSSRRSRRVSSQQNSKKYSQEYQENSEESEEEQPSNRKSRRASSPQNSDMDSQEQQENSEEEYASKRKSQRVSRARKSDADSQEEPDETEENQDQSEEQQEESEEESNRRSRQTRASSLQNSVNYSQEYQQHSEEQQDSEEEQQSVHRSRRVSSPHNSDLDSQGHRSESENDRTNRRVIKKAHKSKSQANKENREYPNEGRASRKRSQRLDDFPQNAKKPKKESAELRFLYQYTELDLPNSPNPTGIRKSKRPKMYRKPKSTVRYAEEIRLVYGIYDKKEARKKKKYQKEIAEAIKCPTFVALTQNSKNNVDPLLLTDCWLTDDLLEMLKKDKDAGNIEVQKQSKKRDRKPKAKLRTIRENIENSNQNDDDSDTGFDSHSANSRDNNQLNILSIIKNRINRPEFTFNDDTEAYLCKENYCHVAVENMEFAQLCPGVNVISSPFDTNDGYLSLEPLKVKGLSKLKTSQVIMWILEGCVTVTINGEDIDCSPGSKLTAKNCKYYITNKSETDMAIIYFIRIPVESSSDGSLTKT